MGLNKIYIGDGWPLCLDAGRHFLKRGATYRLLGTSASPRHLSQPSAWANNQSVQMLLLSPNSKLKQRLCNQSNPGSGPCRYEPKVVLDDSLPCVGVECDIESPRVLEVEPGLFYEYSRIPCVQQAFYPNPKTQKRKNNRYFCGDPRTETGGLACCSSDGTSNGAEIAYEMFSGERLTFSLAERRCVENGRALCKKPELRCRDCDTVDDNVGYWASQRCDLKVKIDLDGNVAIVHSIPDGEVGTARIHETVRQDTKTFFRVDWITGIIDVLMTDYATKCLQLGCSRDRNDNLCLCPVEVLELQAFSSPPSRQDVLNACFVGAFSPDYYDKVFRKTELGKGVRMYSKNGRMSKDSIFEVVDKNGLTQYRKNIKSVVVVGSNPLLPLYFRNPPHFISFTYPELRDAHYETNAGLDHYFVSIHRFRRNVSCYCDSSYLVLPSSTTQIQPLFLPFGSLSASVYPTHPLDTSKQLQMLSELEYILIKLPT